MTRSPVLALCALLILGGFLTTALSGQGNQEKDLKQRVAKLESKVKQMSDEAKARNAILRDLDRRIMASDAFLAELPAVVASLAKGVAAAEKAGFTYAAPNPKSKELLLKALSSFGKDLEFRRTEPEALIGKIANSACSTQRLMRFMGHSCPWR